MARIGPACGEGEDGEASPTATLSAVIGRTEAPDNLFFIAENADRFVSAGFFLDPVRLEGTSVGITVGPVGA